ncbi:hypothetical protein CIB93_33195 [Streptomyces sp. WZ.A104]|uniref:hypothetical protein n=1 Tax=Streptomyces sp. WZ.A104 TaxID=2023771 RepID=UPI000BBBAE91|nr:hypothetical protein [Streptomyces sp. WZ.A104]PCG81848.1 hypothetical protein CIB93_33195 [Streptomyces sp. WZ.A104]
MTREEIVDGRLAACNARGPEAFLGFCVKDAPVYAFPPGEEMADRSGAAFRERYAALPSGPARTCPPNSSRGSSTAGS